MTTIHASTAGASARYYTEYLADDSPDGEGHWVGRQAAELGLAGHVDRDDLEALLSGRDPTTGTRLGSALVDRATPRVTSSERSPGSTPPSALQSRCRRGGD